MSGRGAPAPIEHFFVSHNEMAAKTFRPQGCLDRAEAHALVEAGIGRKKKG